MKYLDLFYTSQDLFGVTWEHLLKKKKFASASASISTSESDGNSNSNTLSVSASSKKTSLTAITPVSNEEMPSTENQCVICMSEARTNALLPCRHMCLCDVCANTMKDNMRERGAAQNRCPICREEITAMIRINRNKTKN